MIDKRIIPAYVAEFMATVYWRPGGKHVSSFPMELNIINTP